MVSPAEPVGKDWPLSRLGETFEKTGLRGLIVADSTNHLLGVVTRSDLDRATESESTVQDIMTSEVESVDISEAAGAALNIMGRLEVGIVPVLNDGGEVVGFVNRHAVVKAYQRMSN